MYIIKAIISMSNDLFVFFSVNVATAISYSLPIAMYTKIAYERGFSESFVGFVFAIYSVANICVIPFTNKLIFKVGRFNLLVISNIIKVSDLITR